jgi:hypothetical protein
MAIEKIFIKSPNEVIYTAISLLQRWTVLLREKDRDRVEQALEAIRDWMRSFKPTTTDVVEL